MIQSSSFYHLSHVSKVIYILYFKTKFCRIFSYPYLYSEKKSKHGIRCKVYNFRDCLKVRRLIIL